MRKSRGLIIAEKEWCKGHQAQNLVVLFLHCTYIFKGFRVTCMKYTTSEKFLRNVVLFFIIAGSYERFREFGSALVRCSALKQRIRVKFKTFEARSLEFVEGNLI